jgi:hypothetical protein
MDRRTNGRRWTKGPGQTKPDRRMLTDLGQELTDVERNYDRHRTQLGRTSHGSRMNIEQKEDERWT